MFGVLALAAFVFMASVPLSRDAATIILLVMGFSLSGSILGLSVLAAHLPAAATSVATSLVVTAAFVLGAILQSLIGSSLTAETQTFAGHPSAGSDMFLVYQHGMVWLIGSVAATALASFFFKNPAKIV